MLKRILLFGSIIIIVSFSGCDKGIEPRIDYGPAGFSGKVTFAGTWPEGITRTLIVVFKNSLTSPDDFSAANLAYIVGPIDSNSTEYDYNSIDNNYLGFTMVGGNYSYVVVAQSKTAQISLVRKDWFVAGVYCINGDQSQPKTLTINSGGITPDVNIVVDFNNPPPQPPE